MEKDCKARFWARVLRIIAGAFIVFSLFACVMAFYFPALVASIVALCMACGSGNPLPIAITLLVVAVVIGIPVYIIATELEKCHK